MHTMSPGRYDKVVAIQWLVLSTGGLSHKPPHAMKAEIILNTQIMQTRTSFEPELQVALNTLLDWEQSLGGTKGA